MTTTFEKRLQILHDYAIKQREFGDNNPADPEQAGWDDIND